MSLVQPEVILYQYFRSKRVTFSSVPPVVVLPYLCSLRKRGAVLEFLRAETTPH